MIYAVKSPIYEQKIPSHFRRLKIDGNAIVPNYSAKFDKVHTLGGKFNYTREDAIQSAWSNHTRINLQDLLSGKVNIDIDKLKASEDFVKQLENNEVSADSVDFLNLDLDFKSMSGNNLKKSIDYIASRYSVMKENINTNFTGKEKINHLNRLEEITQRAIDRIAKSVADEVGGFFEENGIADEKNTIYQSVISNFHDCIKEYTDFIKNNKNYANINTGKDAWLKKDMSFMAKKLRDAKASSSNEQVWRKNEKNYTLNEVIKLQSLVKDIKGFSPNDRFGKYVNRFGTEEEIGLQLSQVVLRGRAFNKHIDVSDKIKDMVSRSMENFVTDALTSIQKYLDYEISIKNKNVSIDVIRGYGKLDKAAVYDIIRHVEAEYKNSGNFYYAIMSGASLGAMKYDSKIWDNKYNSLYRYQHTSYWHDFYKVRNKFDGLNQVREPEIDKIMNRWNNFSREVLNGRNSDKKAHYLGNLYA